MDFIDYDPANFSVIAMLVSCLVAQTFDNLYDGGVLLCQYIRQWRA